MSMWRNSESIVAAASRCACREENGAGSTLEQTAIHEAGHVVIATLVGRGTVAEVFVSEHPVDICDIFDEISISDRGIMGGTRFSDVETTLFQDGLIAYGGFFAQCEHLYRNSVDLAPLLPQLRAQASHDVDSFIGALVEARFTEEEVQGVVREIAVTIKRWFDGGAWEEVERVAAALLERGRLSGEEVLELLPGLRSAPPP